MDNRIDSVVVIPCSGGGRASIGVAFWRLRGMGRVWHPGVSSMIRLLQTLHGLTHAGRAYTYVTPDGYHHRISPAKETP